MYHVWYHVGIINNNNPQTLQMTFFFFGIIIIARKKKSKRFRTTECATIVQKKTKRARASGGRQKFKRRTLYLLSYGGSDVVENVGYFEATAIGDRTQDHSLTPTFLLVFFTN